MVSQLPIQIPESVREFAGKSVDQAEKAFTGFVEAAQKSIAMVPIAKMPEPVQEMSKTTLALTDQSLKAAFECARQLVHAKDIQEVLKIQSDYLRSQYAMAQEHMKQLGSSITSKS